MELVKKINKMLRTISYRNAVALPELDRNGVCSMVYNNKFEFNIELPPGSQNLFFYSPLIKNVDDNYEFHAKLLELNYKLSKTEGATISLDQENDDVVLCQEHEVDEISEELFSKHINTFLYTAERCYDLVNRLRQGYWTKTQDHRKPLTGSKPTAFTMKV